MVSGNATSAPCRSTRPRSTRCVHTLGNAYAAFDEQDVGSLQPGKLADLVIWDRDLRAVETAEDVRRLKVQATYLGGRCVFTA